MILARGRQNGPNCRTRLFSSRFFHLPTWFSKLFVVWSDGYPSGRPSFIVRAASTYNKHASVLTLIRIYAQQELGIITVMIHCPAKGEFWGQKTGQSQMQNNYLCFRGALLNVRVHEQRFGYQSLSRFTAWRGLFVHER